QQRVSLRGRERSIFVARIAGLAVVGHDRVVHRRRTAVVQRRLLELQSPQRRRAHLARARSALHEAVTERPLSCTRKSGYGENVTWLIAESALTPVWNVGVWHCAQPIWLKIACPGSPGIEGLGGVGGARYVMKSAGSARVPLVRSFGWVLAGFDTRSW